MAQEGGVYCAGSICQTASLYAEGAGKECVQKRFEEQIQIFLRNDVDLLIAEVRHDCHFKVREKADFSLLKLFYSSTMISSYSVAFLSNTIGNVHLMCSPFS